MGRAEIDRTDALDQSQQDAAGQRPGHAAETAERVKSLAAEVLENFAMLYEKNR